HPLRFLLQGSLVQRTELAGDVVAFLEVLRVGRARLYRAQVGDAAHLARFEAAWHGERFRGQASRRAAHEIRPDGQRHARAGTAGDDSLGLIEADPYADDDRGVEADEPRVVVVVRGSGLAANRT